MSPAELEDWIALADQCAGLEYDGATWHETAPLDRRVWLLCRDAEPRPADSAYLRAYTGTCLLVDVESRAALTPILPYAHHPGQRTTTARGTPDVDGDGQRDIAWTLPHVQYLFRSRPNSAGRHDPAGSVQPVRRWLTRSRSWSDVVPGTAIQLHAGRQDRPVSIGCWTLPPDAYAVLTQAIQRCGEHEIAGVWGPVG